MEAKDYQPQAQLTLSNAFHGRKVTLAELRGAMLEFIKAADRLDVIKKALFYGKGLDVGLTTAVDAVFAADGLYKLMPAFLSDKQSHSVGEGVEAQKRAENAFHGAIGKATESGELIEAFAAAIWGEHRLDLINVIEEVGDGLWYDAVLLQAVGSDFPDAMGRNNAKLRHRFAQGFTEYDAINRDLAGERAILAQAGVVDDEPISFPPQRDRLGLPEPETVSIPKADAIAERKAANASSQPSQFDGYRGQGRPEK